jgi:thiamine-phosphate pyrophosphorylase
MRVHALVDDLAGAARAVAAGATVVQLRVKATTEEVISRGYGIRSLDTTFIVNDDVEAALALEADGVHLGQSDQGAEIAREHGLILGRSASTFEEAMRAEADYLGVGPIWATPSKLDAARPIGLAELARICRSTTIPVIAIGGVDASNAARCIESGASGVAVVRAAFDPLLRPIVDRALETPMRIDS